MAETVCLICLKQCDDPRILRCGHTFCKRCIEGVIREKRKIECPLCLTETPIPTNGDASDPAALLPRNLVVIEEQAKRRKQTVFHCDE